MEIGPKPFIIAEMSGNHGGNLAKAVTLISIAGQIGCDAVKIQLYNPEDLGDPSNNAVYEKCRIAKEWLPGLFEVAERWSIPLFSSIFAPWAIEELEKYNCPAYKLASPESTLLPNYQELATLIKQTGKTFIASTGVKDREMVQSLGADYLLYCVSGYPANVTDMDIAYMRDMHFSGFSDHSNDIKTPLAIIAAGAKIIEKHFKLDDDCIDAAFSLNPTQMKLLCDIAHQ